MSDNLLEINIGHVLETSNGTLPMEISLSVPTGSTLAITGPSGAGKTTLLRQIAGLVRPQSGFITYQNKHWFDAESRIHVPAQNRNIGFVFQDYALFPHLTVQENLSYGLEKGIKTDAVNELLHAIDLEQLSNRKPYQLSGGQQQRVALARALVRKPDLLLLDEPLSAVDHTMRGSLQDLLLNFHNKYQFTMIIVTHDLGEIFRLAHQVAVLENGKISKQGLTSEVYLPDQNTENNPVLYGEVLSTTVYPEHIIVRALIQHNVQEFKLPVYMALQMQPGRSFALKYSLNMANIILIDK